MRREIVASPTVDPTTPAWASWSLAGKCLDCRHVWAAYWDRRPVLDDVQATAREISDAIMEHLMVCARSRETA